MPYNRRIIQSKSGNMESVFKILLNADNTQNINAETSNRNKIIYELKNNKAVNDQILNEIIKKMKIRLEETIFYVINQVWKR